MAGIRKDVLVLRGKNILFDGAPHGSEVPVFKSSGSNEVPNITKKIENYADKLVSGNGNKIGTGREVEDDV
ncbi:MAG: hypothetical protein ACXVCY_05035 [Pseudobdellovibrionaceae bacterium]